MPATLPADFFIPDDEYNKAVAGDGPAHGIANPADAAKGKAPAAAPTISQDKLREVLTGMLDDKVSELFTKLSAPSSAPATGGAGSTSA